jgi:hypothetical protein
MSRDEESGDILVTTQLKTRTLVRKGGAGEVINKWRGVRIELSWWQAI